MYLKPNVRGIYCWMWNAVADELIDIPCTMERNLWTRVQKNVNCSDLVRLESYFELREYTTQMMTCPSGIIWYPSDHQRSGHHYWIRLPFHALDKSWHLIIMAQSDSKFQTGNLSSILQKWSCEVWSYVRCIHVRALSKYKIETYCFKNNLVINLNIIISLNNNIVLRGMK